MGTSSYTNLELERMAEALQPLLDLNDIVGYTAARNFRLVTGEIAEFIEMKERLLREYGHEVAGDDGEPTGRYAIGPADGGFAEFFPRFTEIAGVRHDIELHRLPAERCIGSLTGRQFLDCTFMIDEDGADD